MGTETIDIPIDDVIVGSRVRKKLGNIRKLSDSMERRGQLQPIGLDPNDNLLFGFRRLTVAQALGWTTIRAERHSSKETALDRLAIENDENECREPLSIEEAVEMKRLLEGIEKPKAEKRKKSGKKQPPANFAEGGETREKVAGTLGYSHETLRKAETVLDAAKSPDATPVVKEAAAKMVETGKVDPAFKAVHAATSPAAVAPNPADELVSRRTRFILKAEELVREWYPICDLDRDADRPGMIELLGKVIAKANGKKRRVSPQAVDETDRYVLQLWTEYPRHEGKGAALKAIKKALDTAAYIDLLAAVKEYAEAKRGEDPKLIPHPATWFNQRRWEDDRTMWRTTSKPRGKLDAFDEWVPPDQRGGRQPTVIETTATRVPLIEQDDESKLPF